MSLAREKGKLRGSCWQISTLEWRSVCGIIWQMIFLRRRLAPAESDELHLPKCI